MVMERAAEGTDDIGAVISGLIISNLRFADDIATLAESRMSLQDMVRNINREVADLGSTSMPLRQRHSASRNRIR